MKDEKKNTEKPATPISLDQLKVQYADLQLLRETLAEQLNVVNQKMLGIKRQIRNETMERQKPKG